ncbi:GntR family transcriptional regulator [Amycolatopsis sp. MJM2582]|uniref:GntR family transcriptional regulator n=1 Tax=Amycolatopsis sp. MJM2582 TaxID=1427749 RepID=UPI0009DEDA9A|nr:GntR family transcriptional regulator [Amycolatopsis sp. MJM2582]
MAEPAYVAIAGEYARKIRAGELPAGVQLPSYAELAERHGVSDIVVRRAIELLQNQGLVRAVRRRGVFVADRTNLVRIAPERQMETAETTFGNESNHPVRVDRESQRVPASGELAEILGVEVGDQILHVVTRASENRQPIHISDTYQPIGIEGVSAAKYLEETIADRPPVPTHAEWLRVTPGDLVKAIHQRFTDEQGKVVMVSDVSYPLDRYDAFVFRMTLN